MIINGALIKYRDVEIDLLLSDVLKRPREFLFMHPEYRMSESRSIRLQEMIRRRQKGEPIAYILGYKDFMGNRFKVNRNVLIPRPETEGLVEKIKDKVLKIKGTDKKIKILDVGTGSGNIIISLAKALYPHPSLPPRGGGLKRGSYGFYASDISKKALAVAGQNTRMHKVKVKFIHSDILQNIGILPDVIVANLPYVPFNDYRRLKKSLRFEPKQAIFAKKRGLIFIEKLFKQIIGLKQWPKVVFLEFDPRQKNFLSKVIKLYLPHARARFYRDLNGFWRYTEITNLARKALKG